MLGAPREEAASKMLGCLEAGVVTGEMASRSAAAAAPSAAAACWGDRGDSSPMGLLPLLAAAAATLGEDGPWGGLQFNRLDQFLRRINCKKSLQEAISVHGVSKAMEENEFTKQQLSCPAWLLLSFSQFPARARRRPVLGPNIGLPKSL